MRSALLVVLTSLALAQSPPVVFDAVSIRPQPWTNEGAVNVYVRGNTLYGEHADLYRLVEFAWNLPAEGYLLSGGPVWAKHGVLSNTSGFDETLFRVIAKAPEGTAPSVDQFRRGLQAVLTERFRLRVHHEEKSVRVYNLVADRGGAKLTENRSDVKASWSGADGPPFRVRAVHEPISLLVSLLADPNHGIGRPVIDKTGLSGFYDFQAEWAPNNLADGGSGPSPFTAVEKLGLKLESTVAAYDSVVIDHAEKPTPN